MLFLITTSVDVHGDELSVDVTSRLAVTTLEGAKRAVWDRDEIDSTPAAVLFDQLDAVTGEGGSIGPLSDGTYIEIKPVKWIDLAKPLGAHWWHVARAAELGDVKAGESLVAAFNAREDR